MSGFDFDKHDKELINAPERFTHRDKAEKLLACFEGIDDDLIAEAAQAASHRPKGRFPWLTLGNIAAVLVGAVAVSCVLMLVFWLSNMGGVPSADENDKYDNGYNSNDDGYYELAVTPSPAPETLDDSIPFPYGLPLPRLHHTSSWSPTILEAGRTHATVNNPWLDAGHIAELPVFRRVVAERGMAGWRTLYDIQLSDEEWYEFVTRLQQTAAWIAIFSDINIDYTESRINAHHDEFNDLFINWVPQGLGSFMDKNFLDTGMRIAFPEDSVLLPAGMSLSEGAAPEDIQAAIEYLSGLFGPAIAMDTPTLSQAEITLDVGGPRAYHRHRFFDGGGSILDAILAFNFEWVEVLTFLPDRPQRMHVSTFPQKWAESLQLGNFPIITEDEARELLLQGYFISERTDTEWPGREAALTASVELVYHRDAEVIMPFYRFLLEIDLPSWMLDEPGEWRAFASYYVPAVHRDYLMPMTRRATPEPIEPPTGPRALPPHIFRQAHAQNWDEWDGTWALRIPRRHVEELWQEILDEIGGLAVNEAYQFRTPCGLYAMITGSRNLVSHAELMRYYPELGLPERVGDFTLREIYVNDGTNFMVIRDTPLLASNHFRFGGPHQYRESPAPVGEIFTRELTINGHTLAFAFYAMYENSAGVQVGLGASSLFFDVSSGLPVPHTTVDMGDYGTVHFPGSAAYYKAVFEPTEPWMGFGVELWFLGGPINGRDSYLDLRYNYDRYSHLFIPVPREELEELVQLFNPAALALEYQWELMSWQ